VSFKNEAIGGYFPAISTRQKTEAEAEILLHEMKRMGWIKSYVLAESPVAQDLAIFFG
jgi:hypothetical protein